MANLRIPKSKRKRKNNSISNFSELLPEELLELIFECLWRPRKNIILGATVDFVRISAVCKKWQRVSSTVNKRSGIVGPLIFVSPLPRLKSRLSSLYDFSSDITQTLLLPRTFERRFINSWNEWLVTAEYRGLNCKPVYPGYLAHFYIHFYNMFSGAYIQLPQSSGPDVICAKKIIPSCTPLDSNCVIMAIPFDSLKLAFCKIGAKKWEIIETKSNSERYDDLIYYKNEFYAVTKHGNLFVCDLKGLKARKIACLDLVYEEKGNNNLVEISGDLFLIVRRFHPLAGALPFAVYKIKMDFSKYEWQEVHSLGEGNSIFIGKNMSICISANNNISIQSDCIYFNDNYGIKRAPGIGVGIGVIDLKTKLVQPTFPPSRLWKSSSYLFWMTKV